MALMNDRYIPIFISESFYIEVKQGQVHGQNRDFCDLRRISVPENGLIKLYLNRTGIKLLKMTSIPDIRGQYIVSTCQNQKTVIRF